MSSVAVAQPGARWSLRRLSPRAALLWGVALVGLAFVWASTRGAYAIAPAQLWQVLLQALGAAPSAEQAPEYLVFINIRLPRLLMGVAAGAGLGLAGALMQGLFRNPLADPGLVGVSSGAALAAAVTIVLGSHWLPDLPRTLGSWTLVGMAFGGGLLVTALIYALAQADGGTRTASMTPSGARPSTMSPLPNRSIACQCTELIIVSSVFRISAKWLAGSRCSLCAGA